LPYQIIDWFETDQQGWWRDVNIRDFGARWGGEVAAARLTRHLKPEKITTYANEPPGKFLRGNLLVQEFQFCRLLGV
jgi:hypothetical protein